MKLPGYYYQMCGRYASDKATLSDRNVSRCACRCNKTSDGFFLTYNWTSLLVLNCLCVFLLMRLQKRSRKTNISKTDAECFCHVPHIFFLFSSSYTGIIVSFHRDRKTEHTATIVGEISSDPITQSPINYLLREWINRSDSVCVCVQVLTDLFTVLKGCTTETLSRLETPHSWAGWSGPFPHFIVYSEKSTGALSVYSVSARVS